MMAQASQPSRRSLDGSVAVRIGQYCGHLSFRLQLGARHKVLNPADFPKTALSADSGGNKAERVALAPLRTVSARRRSSNSYAEDGECPIHASLDVERSHRRFPSAFGIARAAGSVGQKVADRRGQRFMIVERRQRPVHVV